MKYSVFTVAAAGALLIGGVAAGTAFGAGAAKRTILDRIDIAGTDRVAEIGLGDAASGASLGFHSHPGEELAYVLSGSVVLKIRGKPDRLLHAGDTYTLPRGEIHDIVGSGGPSRVVVVWVVDKSKPLSTPQP